MVENVSGVIDGEVAGLCQVQIQFAFGHSRLHRTAPVTHEREIYGVTTRPTICSRPCEAAELLRRASDDNVFHFAKIRAYVSCDIGELGEG